MFTFITKNHKRINQITLLFIGLFVFFHILNHLSALISIDAHIKIMEIFRKFYRNTYIEILLLGSILFHIIQTIKKLWVKRKENTTILQKIELFAKIYLIYFLINHISAVLVGRYIFELNTNIYYAIAGLYISPFLYYFIPYYFLSIITIFFFLSKKQNSYIFYGINILGFCIAVLLLAAFKGNFYDINIPLEYLKMYQG